MATRTPEKGQSTELGQGSRIERRHGKSELSPKLASAIKGGARVAGEELLMSVIPVARIPKLLKLIKGLTKTGKKAPTKGALKSMLEERGFKKLASVDPSLNELEVFLKKRSTRSDEIIRVSGRAPSTDRVKGAYKSLPRMRREAKALGKDLEPGQLELEHGSNLISAGRKEGSEALKSHGRAAIRKSDRKKALSKMVRKAAESRLGNFEAESRELLKLRQLNLFNPKKHGAAFKAQIEKASKALEKARATGRDVYVSKRIADLLPKAKK